MIIMKRLIFGSHETDTVRQFDNCLKTGHVAGGVLCADGHYGYSQPVGGVVVYDGQVSPSGVGYDIACGNKAVKTDLKYHSIKEHIPTIMDEVIKKVPFGIGKKSKRKVDHALFDDPDWDVFKAFGTHEHDSLKAKPGDNSEQIGRAHV